MGFTAGALIFLVIHDRFRIFAQLRVNHMLRVVVVAYLVLLVYELALLDSMRLPGSTFLVVIVGISFAVAGFIWIASNRGPEVRAPGLNRPYTAARLRYSARKHILLLRTLFVRAVNGRLSHARRAPRLGAGRTSHATLILAVTAYGGAAIIMPR
jgi:hypothetical protein